MRNAKDSQQRVLPFARLILISVGLGGAHGALAVVSTYNDFGTFSAAAGLLSEESFESEAATNIFDLTDLTLTDFSLSGDNPFGVIDAPAFGGAFATNGTNYIVGSVATTYTFEFSVPQNFFALTITDFGDNAADDLIITVGTDQYIWRDSSDADVGNGSDVFFGYSDTGSAFTTVTISTPGDAIGIDDVQYAAISAVPIPPAILLSLSGLGALSLVGRRERANASE